MLKPMVPAISTTLPNEFRYINGAANNCGSNSPSRTLGHNSTINEFRLNASSAG